MCDGSVSASVFFWHLCKLESKISRVPSADGTGPVPADPQAGVRALDLARTLLPAQRRNWAPELRLPLVVNAQGAFHRSNISTEVVSRPSGRESGRLFHHPLVMESTVCTASMVLRDIASKRVVSVPAQRSPYYGQNNCRGHRWHAGR
mgnify:CR=1 FL=1